MVRVAAIFIAAALFVASCDARARSAAFIKPKSTQVRNQIVDQSQCVERYFDAQLIDHFGVDKVGTYKQRYFVCDAHWRNTTNSPIFFYTGNESDVELYVNHTGLMYETAPQFNALIVFAEHRYFGKSQPFGANAPNHMQYLSLEQALADYAHFLSWFKSTNGLENSPVVAFGGSYGGMLSSWFRMKYPAQVVGAIAASAPILNFLGMNPPFNLNSFAQVETRDASPAAGSNAQCVPVSRQIYKNILHMGQMNKGRAQLTEAFRLCTLLEDPLKLANWVKNAWDNMAMGDFPYPSDYLTGDGLLPAFPVRVACEHLNINTTDPFDQFLAMNDAISIFYNVTKNLVCNDINGDVNNASTLTDLYWDYLTCNGIFMPQGQDGVNDMFWPAPFDLQEAIDHCEKTWKITPQIYWIAETYGGWEALKYTSNIVFSNGILDPWMPGGVTHSIANTTVFFVQTGSAHHLDLMFSNPLDPPTVVAARKFEVDQIRKWLSQHTI